MSAPGEWGDKDNKIQVLELSQPFFVMIFDLSDSIQCYIVSFYGRDISITEAKDGVKLFAYVIWVFSTKCWSVWLKKEKNIPCWELIFGGWKLSHRIWLHALSQKSASDWFALISPLLGKSLLPWLSSWKIYFLFSSSKTWVTYLLKTKSQYKGKHCWYICKRRSRFSWKSRLRTKMEEEMKFYKTLYLLGHAGKVF